MAWARCGWGIEMRMRGAAVGLVLLAGCASTPAPAPDPSSGQVGVRDVTAAIPTDARLTLGANETFQPPLASPDNPLPDYPAALLARRLAPRAVCVQVGIDERGGVIGTAPASGNVDCPSVLDDTRPFYEAAAAAVQAWRFEPAFRCVFERAPEPGEACGGSGTQEEAQAVSLVYRFVFEQVDGRGVVRVGN